MRKDWEGAESLVSRGASITNNKLRGLRYGGCQFLFVSGFGQIKAGYIVIPLATAQPSTVARIRRRGSSRATKNLDRVTVCSVYQIMKPR